ncbi:hypothetical protein V6C27_03275 [Peptococcaceae bacterium 1198_IL3148]
MSGRKLDKYYQNNFLYRSHTMMLPEMLEKNIHTCQDCVYFVTVIGKCQNKTCCVQTISVYHNKAKMPPKQISIYDLLKHLSPEQLMDLVETSSAYKICCSSFIKKIVVAGG